MTTVHFIGQDHENGQATGVYHLTINGHAYLYDWFTDMLTNVEDDYEIARVNLPGEILHAFHQAWDPEAYQMAIDVTPTDGNGIPMETEDPTSPEYYPSKPAGEPMELQHGHVTTVDLTDLI